MADTGGRPDISRESAEALFLANQAAIQRIVHHVCRQLGIRGDHLEEFAGQVRLRLIEKDYYVLRQWKGRSTLPTYLTTVIRREGLSYLAIRHGSKWRASAIAKKAGPQGIRLEQLIVRDSMPLEQALDVVERHFEPVDRKALRRLAARFPLKTRRIDVGEELLEFVAGDTPDAERLLVAAEEAERFTRVKVRLEGSLGQLKPQARLILQMRFEQDLKVVDIARLLDLDQKRLYRTIEQALDSLREALEAEGVDASNVRAMLDTLHDDTGRESEPPGPLLRRNAP